MGKLSYLLALLSLLSINIYVADSYTLTASVLNQLGYHNQSWDINVDDNNIDNIDPNAFNAYLNLNTLTIKTNSITLIDLVLFKNILTLSTLTLILPSLIKITNPNNAKLPSLRTFLISGDMSKSIEIANNVTNGIANLTQLVLISQLNPLKTNQLVGLNKLTYLTLKNTNQTSLNKAMFNGLTSLKNFYCEGNSNNIKTIDVHTFESLPNLSALDVNSNFITSFEYLQIPNKLQVLDLSKNQMNYFALSRTMGVLLGLNIKNNRFRSFRSMNFTFLTNLNSLYLGNNPHAYTYEIPGHLKPLLELQVAFLDNLTISSIDANYFQNNIKLRRIYMDHNQISSINNRSFIGPTNLELVHLGYNNMSKIRTGTFNCANIQSINLGFNQITEIETSSFYGTNPIKPITLVLFNNQIAQIGPSAFGNLKFSSIDLSYNQLTELNNLTFSGVEQIGFLYLSNNRINEIVPGLFDNVIINNIYLEHNLLTELKNTTFAGMSELENVLLSYNNLTTIEIGTFANLPNLMNVYLDNNKLTQLDSSIFAGNNNIRYITLRNNPLLSTANIQSLCPPAAIYCRVEI